MLKGVFPEPNEHIIDSFMFSSAGYDPAKYGPFRIIPYTHRPNRPCPVSMIYVTIGNNLFTYI